MICYGHFDGKVMIKHGILGMVRWQPPRQDSRAPIPSALETFKDASMATCQQTTHFPGNLWESVDIA